jgi:hypothetical protein
METYLPFIVPTVIVVFAIAVVMLVASIFQDAKLIGRTRAIRMSFVSVVAFVAMWFVVGGLVSLGFLAARTWVFDHVDQSYRQQPPMPYLSTSLHSPKGVDDVASAASFCSETSCELSAAQREEIKSWLDYFRTWEQDRQYQTRRDLINTLSVLAVATPVFVLLFIMFQRFRGVQSAVRPIYLYSTALIALAGVIFSGGVLLNTGLKQLLLPASGQAPDHYLTSDISNTQVQNIITCAGVCALADDDLAVMYRWQEAMESMRTKAFDAHAATYARTLPLLIVLLPVFGYFILVARKESAQESGEVAS